MTEAITEAEAMAEAGGRLMLDTHQYAGQAHRDTNLAQKGLIPLVVVRVLDRELEQCAAFGGRQQRLQKAWNHSACTGHACDHTWEID
jgi:hypothetical protein